MTLISYGFDLSEPNFLNSSREFQWNASGGYATGDYAYDANGSLTQDKNKAISEIDYNVLNLVKKVVVRNAAGTADKGWVEYVYDASGNKLQKKVTEYSAGVVYSGTIYTSTIVTTTNYVGMFTYETKSYSNSSVSALAYTDQLQFLGQEEGRIRPQRDESGAITGFVYDYMIKDHLGNVRTVLTEEQKQDKYPVASLESSKLSTEESFYNIIESNIVNTSTDPITDLPTYTNDNGIGNNPHDASFEAANSQYIYKLNSNSAKTGLGITLKVMAGDRLDIWGKSYYNQNNTGGSSANVAPTVLELLTDFLGANGGIAGATAHSAVSASTLNSISATTSGVSTLLSDETTDNTSHTSVPKAYINYIFFDEQFKCIGHGFSGVGSNGTMKDHHSDLTNLQAPKNGYVYIYCSNESPVDVFFDNLQVVHTRSPILEETQYYPFGSVITPISSKAVAFGEPENNKKYNGIEKEDALGLEIYDAEFRELDPQTARWWQIDPVTDGYENLSPYTSMYDNPITISDPLGNEGDECCQGLIDAVKGFFSGYADGGTATLNGARDQVNNAVNNFLTLDGLARLNPLNTMTGGALGTPNDFIGSFQGALQTGKQLGTELKSGNTTNISHAIGFVAEKITEVVVLKEIAGGERGGISETRAKGLSNPFKGATLEQVRNSFETRVSNSTMEKKGPNAYINKKSGYSYNVDSGGNYGRGGKKVEQPHVDVNYPNPKPKNVAPKKKLDVKNG